MKPGEIQKVFADQFATLEDLRICLDKIGLVSGQDEALITCEGELILESECLSDGSIVYSVHLHGDISDEERDASIHAVATAIANGPAGDPAHLDCTADKCFAGGDCPVK